MPPTSNTDNHDQKGSEHQMRRINLAAAFLVALLLVVASPAAARPDAGAAAKNKNKPVEVQMLGVQRLPRQPRAAVRLDRRDPDGTNPNVDTPAGGMEYLATHLKRLRGRRTRATR